MITITETAAEKFKAVLKAEGKDDWGIRLYMAGGGCCPSYGLDLCEDASENDEVIEENGIRVYIDRELTPAFTGMKIDYVSDGQHEGFALTGGQPSSCNPDQNAGGGCGCTSC